MPCQYHPNAPVEGICECKKEFCSECANLFIGSKGKFYLCSDCAVAFAKRRIMQSYVVAVIGLIIGIYFISSTKEFGLMLRIFTGLVIYPYLFWATFFGWHFGSRVWGKLSEISANWPWWWGFIFLFLKIFTSAVIGCLCGGIAQFLMYKNMIDRRLQASGRTDADKNA